MAKPVEIQIMADADVKGIDQVADSLGDVEKNLSELESAGEKTERALTDSFEKVEDSAKDAGKSFEKIEDGAKEAADSAKEIDRDFTRALESVEDAAKKTGKSFDRVKDGADRAGEGMDELKDEANSTAKEAAASFDGSFESIADAAQEVAANAFAGFGPAGAAAGLAIAGGIGIAIGKLQEMADKVNEAKEATYELSREFKDAGHNIEDIDFTGMFDEWLGEINDVRSAWELWQDDAVSNMDSVRTAVENTGVSFSELYQVIADPDMSGLDGIIERLEARQDLLKPEGEVFATKAAQEEFEAIETLVDELESQVEMREEAKRIADEQRAAEAGITTEMLAQRDAIAATNDEIREKNDLTADSIRANLNFENGLASMTEVEEGWTATLDINTQQGRDNQAAVLDLTDDIQSMADATLEQTGSQDAANKVLADNKQRLIESMVQMGYSREEATKYINTVLRTPKDVTTTVRLEGQQKASAELDALVAEREVFIRATFDQGQAQQALENVRRNLRVGSITVPVTMAKKEM